MNTGICRNTGAVWRTGFFLCSLLTAGLMLTPREYLPSEIFLWDKHFHALAFAALALCAVLVWPATAFFRFVLLPLLIFGIFIEALQYFVSGRVFSVSDIIAGLSGIIIVWIGVKLLQLIASINRGI